MKGGINLLTGIRGNHKLISFKEFFLKKNFNNALGRLSKNTFGILH